MGRVDDAYDALVRENRDLIGRTVTRLERPPTALEFARDWLGRNQPFVCAGAIETWGARDGRWDTREGLERALGGAEHHLSGPDIYAHTQTFHPKDHGRSMVQKLSHLSRQKRPLR